jgi:6-phosphofructokinase 2
MTVVTVTLNPCIDKAFSVDRMVPDRKLRVITRLGGDALALWSAGGETGRRLAQLLDAEAVPHEAIPLEGPVRERPGLRRAPLRTSGS